MDMNSSQTGDTLILIDQQARTFEIDKRSGWTVGRDPANSLVLNDIKISRRHAVFRWEGDNYVVRDMGSRNGTFVNNERVQSAPLKDGDIIRIGDTEFLVRIGVQQQVEEEVVNQRLQMSTLDTHMEFDEEFRVHLNGFSGSLKTLSMVEIVQTIMQFGKDGRLKITDYNDTHIAEAFFLGGEVVHANIGNKTGVPAMFKLMELENGLFEFENDIVTPERSISQSTMSILMESCKRIDESGRRP
jgi:pSer/pThr/pTyr-binding forkhead associated (FHA) protein